MALTGTPTTVVVSQIEQTSHVKVYLRIFFALLVLTLLEYFYAMWFAEWPMSVLAGGLVLMAVIKAALVGQYFMHLNFEGNWKYLLLIPTFFLAALLVIALLPDIGMEHIDRSEYVEDQLVSAPIAPAPTPAPVRC